MGIHCEKGIRLHEWSSIQGRAETVLLFLFYTSSDNPHYSSIDESNILILELRELSVLYSGAFPLRKRFWENFIIRNSSVPMLVE